MTENNSQHQLNWERFRFAIIGPLLAAPPAKGQLQQQLRELAAKQWVHPLDKHRTIQISVSTLERWYYKALRADNPVDSLKRSTRRDLGATRTVSAEIKSLLEEQYRQHQHWSIQLHYGNLVAKAEKNQLEIPSYSTILRLMRANGWRKQRRPNRSTQGTIDAQRRLQEREVRSYEVDYVNALWHLDYHHGSIKLPHPSGNWRTPKLLGVIDDRSRLLCHLQWYWDETTEALVHGFCQALQKRGLPRALMSDNGSAMTSEEFTQGLHRLSVVHETTLPYSPYQNAKQETFWARLEGQLMAMLVDLKELTLKQLNDYTQAWVEQDYHRSQHRELGMSPLSAYLNTQNVSRQCPTTDALKNAFCREVTRKQRRSDGTLSIEGQRFEIPCAYRDAELIRVRYAQWDLSSISMVDPRTDKVIARLYPLDKSANATGLRRSLKPVQQTKATPTSPESPTLLQNLMQQHADTGLPPAYLHFEKDEENES